MTQEHNPKNPSKHEDWRRFLSDLPKAQREGIIKALDIDQSTLNRWLSSEQQPRASVVQKMRRLPAALLGGEKQLFLQYLEQAFPLLDHPEALAIPASFYQRVLHTYATVAPPLRKWTIIHMIFQQMRQLDPHLSGLHIDLFYCFPSEDHIIRGLVQADHQDLGNFRMPSDTRVWFLGKKSLLGQAVSSGQPRLIQYGEEGETEEEDLFLKVPGASCVTAFPIQRSGEIGGGLLFYSMSATFFHDYFELIQSYAEMFSLALEHFYPLDHIQLDDFPFRHQQQISLYTYHQQIAKMLQSLPQEKAEQQVLLEIQHELLAMNKQKESYDRQRND